MTDIANGSTARKCKLKFSPTNYAVLDGETFLGSVAAAEYGWIASTPDGEPFFIAPTRSEAALWLRENYWHERR